MSELPIWFIIFREKFREAQKESKEERRTSASVDELPKNASQEVDNFLEK